MNLHFPNITAIDTNDISTWSFTDRIAKLVLPVKEQELFDTYIKSHTWEGFAWFDGGWSSKKNEIMELMLGDPVTGFKLPFLFVPNNTLNSDSIEISRDYKVAFPGEQYKILLHLIKAVKELGVKKQKYLLKSYFSTSLPTEGISIYQLEIEVEDKVSIRINKGNWVPNFDNTFPAAGWDENA